MAAWLRRAVGCAWILLVMLASASVSAEPKAEAEALLARGVQQRAAGDEQRALESFRAAYALVPSARARGQTGLAAKSVRAFVEAEECLTEALAQDGDPWVIRNRVVLQEALSIVEGNLAWLDVRTEPAEATLLVNGKSEPLPLARPLRVVAGVVQIELSAPDYEPYTAEQTIPAHQTLTLRIPLTPHPKQQPPPAAAGPPPPPPPTEAPPAILQAAAPPAPPPRERHARPAEQPGISRMRATAYAVGAVGAVGLAVSGILAVRTLDLKSQRDAICPAPQCPTSRGVELDRDARRDASYATVAFAVGTVALGTSLGLLFAARPEAPASATLSTLAHLDVRLELADVKRVSLLCRY